MPLVRRSHVAMRTRFEALLVGDDAEHLEAVATLVFEEVDRVERLLSRFDPSSETYRVNAQAAERPVRVSVELAEVLDDCYRWWQATDGDFDVCHGGPGWPAVKLDRETRILRFTEPGLSFDFGGYGKGYALDRANDLLTKYRVENAFLHGGTSSVLARGIDADGKLWQVDLPNGQPIALDNLSLSTSEYETPAGEGSEPQRIACSVVAESGATAEALSTALVRRSEAGVAAFYESYLPAHSDVRVVWTDLNAERTVQWPG